MTLRHITDLQTPIGHALDSAGTDGLLVEREGRPTHAIIPLDEELIDYLLEQNPAFIEQCRQIRDRMRAGEFVSHEQLRSED